MTFHFMNIKFYNELKTDRQMGQTDQNKLPDKPKGLRQKKIYSNDKNKKKHDNPIKK